MQDEVRVGLLQCGLVAFALGIGTSSLATSVGTEAADQRIPVQVFAGEPRGPFRTGTVEELWVDEERGEDTTADPADKRHLMVQIWYPAEAGVHAAFAPYVLRREIYPAEGWLEAVKHVLTTSVAKARLVKEPERLPVVLYNPGGNSPHFSGTFQTEFLASHGYVVVAIGRPDNFGPLREGYYPDGYVYRRAPMGEPSRYENADGSLAVAQMERDRWMADVRFVLDRLRLADSTRESRFRGRLDLDRIGALGWSAGGLTSLRAASEDPRITAAVNLDNPLTAYPVPEKVRQPILVMHQDVRRQRQLLVDVCAQKDVQQRAQWARLPAFFTQFYARSTADWYDATLEGATHLHFSDRTLFQPSVPGEMHPRLAHEIINRYTLEFFDRHLRQQPHAPLLTGEQVYAGVEFFKGSGRREVP